MTSETVVHLKNGDVFQGILMRPFRTDHVDIEIAIGEDDRNRVFAMDEICYMVFADVPDWAEPSETARIEELQTIRGETFYLAVFQNDEQVNGIAGIIRGGDQSGRTIYFPYSAVRARSEQRLMGEIFEELGIITNADIKNVLEEQDGLRNRLVGEVIAESAEISREVIEKTLRDAGKTARSTRQGVGEILIEAGLVTKEQVEEALESQKVGKKLKIGELLVKRGLITEEQCLAALAQKFQMKYIDLETIHPSREALGIFSEGLVSRMKVLPIAYDGYKLTVATSTPTDITVSDSLRFSTHRSIELVVASPAQIQQAIDRYYHGKPEAAEDLLGELREEGPEVAIEEAVDDIQYVEPDSKIINLVNNILMDAYGKNASDVHFEPGIGKSPVVVRYRIDGECLIAHKVSSTVKSAVISRLKIMSGLDIAERRRPQSGKFIMRTKQQTIEFRVETTPTVGGVEDAVLRILPGFKALPLESMDFMPYNFGRLEKILAKPYGIILCVGPTGSGKTTTLHAALGRINTPARKIWTAEDPVEITQPGLRQVQINAKIGFTFSEALRSFLRSDPDVIMIGEMRDGETAKIAVEASLTGHLVFSTLHTNSAPETAVRLIEIGIDPFNFSDALLAIVAQRLSRRLCDKCKKPMAVSKHDYEEWIEGFMHETGSVPEELPKLHAANVMTAVGCDECRQTGYKGRIALHEVMIATPAVKAAIRKKADVDILKKTALAEGMWTLRMDGMMKVLKGYTDMEQVNKVCI